MIGMGGDESGKGRNVLYSPFFDFSSPCLKITWCFSDRASWIDYILTNNLMHWLLFIHKILFSFTSFEPQVLIFRRIQLYSCSIWYCHSLWEFLMACRYAAWVRTVGGRLLVGRLKDNPDVFIFPLLQIFTSLMLHYDAVNMRDWKRRWELIRQIVLRLW